LTSLPGIGRSTAAAIAAFASGECGAILDGNVKRVLARHRGIEGWPGEPAVRAALWRAADAFAADSRHDAAGYTQGLMDVGATICKRTRPRCDVCPVAADCIARRDARVDALPAMRPRKPLPRRAVTVLLLERDGAILLEQRPPLGIWGGLWSLPEAPCGADAAAHVVARFQAAMEAPRPLPVLTHAFTHFELTMNPVRVTITRWPSAANAPGVAWFTREAAQASALPAPIRKLLRRDG
jgi:A/G-specific adenine glycosylase